MNECPVKIQKLQGKEKPAKEMWFRWMKWTTDWGRMNEPIRVNRQADWYGLVNNQASLLQGKDETRRRRRRGWKLWKSNYFQLLLFTIVAPTWPFPQLRIPIEKVQASAQNQQREAQDYKRKVHQQIIMIKDHIWGLFTSQKGKQWLF